MSKKYYCEGCGYGWISKKPFGDPAYCPRCKSEDIEEDVEANEVEENVNKEDKFENEKSCDYCGKEGIKIHATCQYKGFLGSVCRGQKPFSISTDLCKDCAKQCKKCSKFFCQTHIGNHKCV